MRLRTDQIQAIRYAATATFGEDTAVWLFGPHYRHPDPIKGVPPRLFVGEFAPFDAILCGGSSDEFDQNAQNCPLTS
jgi:hypothetical protein